MSSSFNPALRGNARESVCMLRPPSRMARKPALAASCEKPLSGSALTSAASAFFTFNSERHRPSASCSFFVAPSAAIASGAAWLMSIIANAPTAMLRVSACCVWPSGRSAFRASSPPVSRMALIAACLTIDVAPASPASLAKSANLAPSPFHVPARPSAATCTSIFLLLMNSATPARSASGRRFRDREALLNAARTRAWPFSDSLPPTS